MEDAASCQLCSDSRITCCFACLFFVALADLWEEIKWGWGVRKEFLGKLPGQLFQLLRIWSELGATPCLLEVLQNSQLQSKLAVMQTLFWKTGPFEIALNLSLCALSCHLSLSHEHGLDLIRLHHDTHLQFSSLFTLLTVYLNSSVWFQSALCRWQHLIFDRNSAVDTNLVVH